jgi:hypothetical protein
LINPPGRAVEVDPRQVVESGGMRSGKSRDAGTLVASTRAKLSEDRTIGPLDTQDLLPPRIQQTTADRVLARHGRRRRSRIQALQDNLALLLGRPNPPALTTRHQLDARSTRALTTYRMSVLIIRRR